MVYSWGLFWPRELGVLNQRRISPSLRGLGGKQAGRRMRSQTRTKLPLQCLRERKWSSSPALPLPSTRLTIIIAFFSPATSVYARLRGCVSMCVFKCHAALKSGCLHACILMLHGKWRYQSAEDGSLTEGLCEMCVTENTWWLLCVQERQRGGSWHATGEPSAVWSTNHSTCPPFTRAHFLTIDMALLIKMHSYICVVRK